MLEQLALLAAFSDVVKAIMYLVIIGSALLLIAVILLQEGKGGGFGDAFGGMGTETFGARVGGVNKFTATIAAFFFAGILGVHLINRPPAPVEPENDTAQVQPPDMPNSPLGQNGMNQFGNPDSMGNQTPPTPALTPQQIAERQFQLFGGSSTSGAPVNPPTSESGSNATATGENPSGGAAANAAPASVDPWSDPAWGLSPEERAQGALAPEAPPAAPASDAKPDAKSGTPPPADGGGN